MYNMAKLAIVKDNKIMNYIIGEDMKDCEEMLEKLICCNIIDRDNYIDIDDPDNMNITDEDKKDKYIITCECNDIEEHDYYTYYGIISNNSDYTNSVRDYTKDYTIGGHLIKSNDDQTITLTNDIILNKVFIDDKIHYYDNNNEEWIEFNIIEYKYGHVIESIFTYGFFKVK